MNFIKSINKDLIKNKNIPYPITTYNILNSYTEFKNTQNKKILIQNINKYLEWLENQKNITLFNIIEISKTILKNKTIRLYIINNNKKLLYYETLIIINKQNIFKINQKKKLNNLKYQFFYNDSTYLNNSKEILKNLLFDSELEYKDLIFNLLDNLNYNYNKLNLYSDVIKFMSILNSFCYELDHLLNTKKNDLIDIIYILFKNENIDILLFKEINYKTFSTDFIFFIYGVICNSLYNIQNLYFIELKSFNYNNSKKRLSRYNFEDMLFFINEILNYLNSHNKKNLFMLSLLNKNLKINKKYLSLIDKIINDLNNNYNILIIKQELNENVQKLIMDNITFTNNYCYKYKYELLNYKFNNNYLFEANTIILQFNIYYNNYNYLFVLKKNNKKIVWSVKLRNNEYYKINLYLKDDFKHLIQAIYND
ncbi:MAG: hypothetical protein E7172_00785 [Firmicutes bacterium]|nr:hypothetical protein [Bacillota bacterium]